MERNKRSRLDELLVREPPATLRTLTDKVDVEQRLKELYRLVGADHDPMADERTTAPTTTD